MSRPLPAAVMSPSPRQAFVTEGMRHMLLGVLCFSVMGIFTKAAGARLPVAELVFARAVVTLGLSLYALRNHGPARFGDKRRLLLLRGLFGFVALNCFFYSLTHLPLADATVLQFTNPLLTALLAAVMLRERMTVIEVFGGLVCLAGVVLVARPSFLFGHAAALDPLAVTIALVGATFSALAYVTVRQLGSSEDPLVVVFYFALVALPGSLLMLAFVDPVWPRGMEWAFLVGLGIFAQLGQIELTRGLRLETAGRASTANYVQVLLAYGGGMLFFAEVPTIVGAMGAICIAGGTLLVARRRGRPPAVPTASGAS